MSFDTDLRSRLSYARHAEPTERELLALRRALRQPVQRARRPRRLVLALVGLAVAVPTTAVAAGSLSDAFDSFLHLTRQSSVTVDLDGGTVVDAQQSVVFSVTRSSEQDVCLSLNQSVLVCGDRNDGEWQQQLSDTAVAPVGTIAPEPRSGPVPLFVLTAPSVDRVEVAYSSGAPTTRRVGNGGAVILVDAKRGPRDVIARDASGTEIGRASISERQWTWCYRAAGCPDMGSE